jgi:pimeloyl-ACP methyl ester carboxylesterase
MHVQISLVGHSQGGTLALMLLSRRAEYNDKINVNIGLAPVIYVK